MDAKKYKIFNDSIHGYIKVHPLCVAIIDTEQFQRLRYIKQMGGTYFVYPGASHNRFEHSIGTSYLAGYFVESLKREQKDLDSKSLHVKDADGNDVDKDVLCIKIAGLCHDLGHGPFSHMFDNDFIPKVRKGKNWSHEEASKAMFDHLIKSNPNVSEMFEYYKLGKEDKEFIKKLMTGETPKNEKDWIAVGRKDEKDQQHFLFEIVANKINGIDVDKWDYFARDCRYLGIKSSFDHMRCIQLARVIDPQEKGLPYICYRNRAVGDIYDMFHTRLSIHKKACQHKTGNAVEMMITEALEMADSSGYLEIKGENGSRKTISTAIDDMVAYTKLTDNVYQQILYFEEEKSQVKAQEEDQGEDKKKNIEKMIKAKEILKKIEKRELYKFIGYTIPDPKDIPDLKDISAKNGYILAMRNAIFKIFCEKNEGLKSPSEGRLEEDDIVVTPTSFSYGGGIDANPVDKVLFYAKDNEDESLNIEKDQVSRMLPKEFSELEIRVYCKKRDVDIKKMRKAFRKVCKDRGYKRKYYSYVQPQKDEDSADDQGTPQNTDAE